MKNFKSWFENYWYHYKWATIISAISIFALCVCLFQCTKKQEYDMYALYAGPIYIGGEQSKALSDSINDYMSDDKQAVCINSFTYVSEEKIEEYKKDDVYVNEGIIMQQANDFFDFLYTANFNMLILDSELYSRIDKEKLICPLSDISNIAQEKSKDGYCLNLSDTKLREKYKIFAEMPDDTVLCFRKNVLMQNLASANNKQTYEYHKDVFKMIIEE